MGANQTSQVQAHHDNRGRVQQPVTNRSPPNASSHPVWNPYGFRSGGANGISVETTENTRATVDSAPVRVAAIGGAGKESGVYGQSPVPSTNPSKWQEYNSARSAWNIVGIIAVFLLLGLVIWFIWWMLAPRDVYSQTSSSCDRGPANVDVGNMSSRNIHAHGDVTVSDNLSVCKVASFPNGVIAPHIAAGCEDAIEVHDPLVCKHALVRAVCNREEVKIDEFISGVNNCTNASGQQVTGWLPHVHRFKGSTIVTVNNRSGHAHVIVRAQKGDKIQNKYHAYNVGNSVQFESDGAGTWWVH